ncbi:MAG: hypothetical protein KDD48_07750 [Bdellovibrionales bacterium]|nr:hypothetical protein [Bdellovibrionales bacterium]
MQLTLIKDCVKTIPFNEGRTIEYRVGYLLDENQEKLFRYTRSMKPVHDSFKITLQYETDSEHIPYVFKLHTQKRGDLPHIKPESASALDVWKTKPLPMFAELKTALEVITKDDIEHE